MVTNKCQQNDVAIGPLSRHKSFSTQMSLAQCHIKHGAILHPSVFLMLSDKYPSHIGPLIQQCMEWCDSFTLPILVPLSSWLPDPRAELITSVEIPEGVTKVCTTVNGQHVFCATPRNDIRMYHIPSKTLIKTLTGTHQATPLASVHLRFCSSRSLWCVRIFFSTINGPVGPIITNVYECYHLPVTCVKKKHVCTIYGSRWAFTLIRPQHSKGESLNSVVYMK